jgi:hypothetical protein
MHDKDPASVTAGDWDNIVREAEGMVVFIFGKRFSKENWPKGVPYLNMIALAKYTYERANKRIQRWNSRWQRLWPRTQS